MALPRLYLNHIASLDWLIALEFGRVDEGQPTGSWEGVSEQFGYLHDSDSGRIVGFKVLDYSTFDPQDPEVSDIWTAADFEVPLLGLPRASAGEIILAARALLGERETVNRAYFTAAMDAQEDPEQALELWLACLQTGDCMAHYALGYTLHQLGRHHNAYRHLRYYTEISPAGAWNWCWRGRAAEALSELDEARTAYRRAIELDTDEVETDAAELLAELEAG